MISISQFSNLSRIIRALENNDFLKENNLGRDGDRNTNYTQVDHNEYQSANYRDINYKEGLNKENTAFNSEDVESIQYEDQDSINQDRDHSKEIEELYKEVEVKMQRRSQFNTDLSSKKLKEAIIWSELLGPPLSKRRRNK